MPATALFAELLDVVLNYLFVHGSAQGSLTQILQIACISLSCLVDQHSHPYLSYALSYKAF